ncbi:LpqB family beta-propeller domain-containing protein [Demequina activiva]|uniref:Lipoprotein LpqB n=1 Tax=Demequina activiva TaxID=1582364 RepID=A0A919Q357_9MICO|nr:LpqB family beta-propeller domain-containing protein [Demequina activiva]GIG55402.1 lipoprotein LpqB [Demequina activiva]
MRLRGLAIMCAAVLALAACASIPDSGPVNEGDADVSPVEPLVPIQEGPNPGDDPEAIVRGFLTASAGGVATDFSVAREFLTEEAAAQWDPTVQTLVYDSGTVTPDWDEPSRTVTYEVPLASAVDESGRRVDAAGDEVARLEFTVALDDDDQWRISRLEDGVLLTQANFDRFFRPVDLVFATADRTTIVPELRWLPDNNVATSAARELIEGPSTWLADAVLTGFPATAALAVESVVVSGGVATVDLTVQSAGTADERALAEEQMRQTLTGLPSVTDVDVRIGGLPIAGDGSIALATAPVPEETAAAIVNDQLGMWDGEDLFVGPLASGGLGEGSYGVAMAYDGGTVAFVRGGSALVTTPSLGAAGTVLVEATSGLGEPTGLLEAQTVRTGDALVSPSYDRHGYLWTAERTGAGGLVAVAPDGTSVELASEWLQTRSVIGLSVSRDDARLAVISRSGGQPAVELAAIVRDADGAPLSLGEPISAGAGVGAGVDVVWVDDTTVGVLGEPLDGSPSPLWLVQVGGGTSTILSVRQAVDMAVRSGESTVLVVAADGTVEERSGSSWAPVTQGVAELAYSG